MSRTKREHQSTNGRTRRPDHIDGVGTAALEAPLPVRWHWRGAIQRAALCLIDGRKGTGKSTLLAALAAALSGGPTPPGWTTSPGRGVLWIGTEEDYRSVVWPRLDACGAAMVRCYRPDLRTSDGRPRGLRLPSGLDDLEELLSRLDIGALILDPIGAALDPGLSLTDEQQARLYLEPLAELASKRDLTILAARHLRKGSAGDVRDHGLGSVAVGNVARSVLRLDEHPQQRGDYTLSVVAGNLGRRLPTQVYRLASASEDLARIEWVAQSDLTAEEIAEGRGSAGEADALRDAEELLRELLKDDWLDAGTVRAEAQRCGITDVTLRRAKVTLRIASKRVQRSKEGHWQWGPPGSAEQVKKDKKSPRPRRSRTHT